MSSPFSSISPNGTPTWSAVESTDGGFEVFNINGVLNIAEVLYGDGLYGDGGYDTQAIINVPISTLPDWSTISADNGNFQKMTVSSHTTVAEVGFSQGGFGQGGFDGPTIIIASSAQPTWTVETTK